MFTALIHFSKKHTALGLVMALVLALAACGGGGGGGTKTLPTTVRVDFPIAASTINATAADFQITLLTGATAGLVITLNNVDVTTLFTQVGTGANSITTASTYALSGLLKDGTNFFNAKTNGSKTSGVEFTYKAKPEAIMTALTGCASGSGTCTVNGETHKAGLLSAAVSTLLASNLAGATSFALAGLNVPVADVTDMKTASSDYTVTTTAMNGLTSSADFILPKSVVKYGAAVQVNNSAMDSNSVLAKWFTTLLKANIEPALASVKATNLWDVPITSGDDLIEANLNTTVRDAKVLLHDGVNACTILKGGQINGNVDECYLLASNIDFSQGLTDSSKVTIIDNADPDKVGVDIEVTLSKLTITFDSLGYYNSAFRGAQQVAVSYTAKFTFHLEAYRGLNTVTGKEAIIGFKVVDIDVDPLTYTGAFAVDLSTPVKTPSKEFCTTSLCKNPLGVGVFGTAAPLIASEVVSKAQPQIASIDEKLSLNTFNNSSVLKFVEEVVATKTAAVTMARVANVLKVTDLSAASDLLVEGMKVTFAIPDNRNNCPSSITHTPANCSAIKSYGSYYVKSLAGSSYQLSLVPFGPAIDIDSADLILTGSHTRKLVIVKPQSLIRFDFLSSVLNEAKSNGVKGLFLGIGGSTFASNDYPLDVYLDANPNTPAFEMPFNWPSSYQDYATLPSLSNPTPALGSYFKPLNSNGKVAKNFFNATDDITVALSENSLNQLLLSAYQSKVLTYQKQTMTVGDLGTSPGDLGYQIISLTSGTALAVAPNDLVTIDFDLQAIPHASFDAAGVEIMLNKLNVKLMLYRNCAVSCTALYKSEFTLDAKALATFGLNGSLPNLPLASIDDVAITVVGNVTNTFLAPTGNTVLDNYVRNAVNTELNAGKIAVIMAAEISTLISDQITSMTQPIVQNLDLKNLGLNNKSAELRLQTLAVDSTHEFIQVSAKLVEVLPADVVKGIVRLNLTDSCMNDDTLPGCPNEPN